MIELGVVLLIEANQAVSAIPNVGGYFGTLPKDATLPAWSYATVSDTADMILGGPTTVGSRRTQIDVYSADAATAIQLANAIDALLNGYRGTLPDPDATVVQGCFRTNMIDFFDVDSRTYRRMLEYVFWVNQ
jgi:hypothetical protein